VVGWLVVVGWLMVDWMVVNWLVVGWLVGWLVTFVKCGRLVRRRLMLTNEYEHETPQQKFNDIFFQPPRVTSNLGSWSHFWNPPPAIFKTY